MIKDIVVALSSAGEISVRDYALSMASRFDAHVTGVSFALDPIMPPALMGGIPVEYVTQQRAQNEELAVQISEAFVETARSFGVSVQSKIMDAGFSDLSAKFGRLARGFDVAVVSQPSSDSIGLDDALIEGVLFESGRPVLIVPHGHLIGASFERALVAWDGSEQSARALHDALPLLQMTSKIGVVSISRSHDEIRDLPAADVALHLARHGLNVDAKNVLCSDGDIAKALISEAINMNADFLVMGGYGHSRLREFILGGTTRGMLAKMSLPVLMAH